MKIAKFNRDPLSIFNYDNFFDNNFFGFPSFFKSENIPAVNVIENKENFQLDIAVPGMNKEDFKLNVTDNVLSISSKKENSKEEKTDNYTRKEFSYSSFERSFTLPKNVNSDDIKASYENGILKINIPKKEKIKDDGRVIDIS